MSWRTDRLHWHDAPSRESRPFTGPRTSCIQRTRVERWDSCHILDFRNHRDAKRNLSVPLGGGQHHRYRDRSVEEHLYLMTRKKCSFFTVWLCEMTESGPSNLVTTSFFHTVGFNFAIMGIINRQTTYHVRMHYKPALSIDHFLVLFKLYGGRVPETVIWQTLVDFKGHWAYCELRVDNFCV